MLRSKPVEINIYLIGVEVHRNTGDRSQRSIKDSIRVKSQKVYCKNNLQTEGEGTSHRNLHLRVI